MGQSGTMCRIPPIDSAGLVLQRICSQPLKEVKCSRPLRHKDTVRHTERLEFDRCGGGNGLLTCHEALNPTSGYMVTGMTSYSTASLRLE